MLIQVLEGLPNICHTETKKYNVTFDDLFPGVRFFIWGIFYCMNDFLFFLKNKKYTFYIKYKDLFNFCSEVLHRLNLEQAILLR